MIFLNFIIPRNYNFKNKILGIIDYPTAIINVILLFFIYKLSCLFFNNLFNRLIIVILFYFPFLLLSIFSYSNESFIFTFYYIFLYLINPKLYLYK